MGALPTPNASPAQGARILTAAAAYNGVPYALPPDGITTLDCSLFVLAAYRDAGFPFPAGVRTAEQERQACELIPLGQVQAGDLVFFEHTYEPGGAPGPDGKIASHVGISFGSGTGRMWDAHQSGSRNGVGVTNIYSDYWQDRLLQRGGRFAPTAAPPPPSGGGFVVAGTGSSGLLVRGAPGTDAPILGTLPDGTRVTGDAHAWRKIRGGLLDGWAADTFLEASTAPPETGAGDPWAYWSAATIASICNVPAENVEQHWPHICAALAERGIDDRRVQTAAIATIAIETASTFRPVREAFWLDEEWREQNLQRYYPYYGRGHIQLTWESNYATAGEKLGLGGGLVADPDLALDADISARVLANYFADRGVADAALEQDWGEVRRRVQGGHVGLDRLLVIVHGLEAA